MFSSRLPSPKAALFCFALGLAAPPGAQATELENYLDLDLQDLLAIEVMSASKNLQELREVAAAIHVITAEDIRRSGASNFADLLRNVPGMNVAQLDAHQWAISARGFSSFRANKLLVLIDGRSIYTPLYGGVFWDVQDTLLEDIDRIEIIRGPGGSLWGANAVNGVINIITRRADETHGKLLIGGIGNEQRQLAMRHGAAAGEDTHYRVYAKLRRTENSRETNNTEAWDGTTFGQVGFRIDHTPANADQWTLQGDAYRGKDNYATVLYGITAPYAGSTDDYEHTRGFNLLGRWTRPLADGASLALQAYYDYTWRSSQIFSEYRHIFDLELQHSLAPIGAHKLTWGASYRLVSDAVENSFVIDINPTKRSDHLFTTFIQDEIELRERLTLTLGSKLEHNAYTGVEIQPSARLAWMPDDHHTLWTSISRAVHTPTRFEHDATISVVVPPSPPATLPTVIAFSGNRGVDSEELVAYEAGLRSRWSNSLTTDIALFYNDYDKLRGVDAASALCMPSATPPPCLTPGDTHLLIDNPSLYHSSGRAYGVELSANWQLTDDWSLIGNYNYLRFDVDAFNAPTGDMINIGTQPQHTANLTARGDLAYNTELDLSLRYVAQLEEKAIPGYIGLDLRLAWQPRPGLELSLVGRNLLDPSHPETTDATINSPATEVERSVYAQLRWDY